MQNIYFFETVSPKNHGQVCMDRKGYQGKLLVLFTENIPTINTSTEKYEKIMAAHLQKHNVRSVRAWPLPHPLPFSTPK